MKTTSAIIILCFFVFFSNAQTTYTIQGVPYDLQTEINGTIDLLWNIIDNEYRYFAKKGDSIVELTNTRDTTKTYQEEYKSILNNLTPERDIPTDAVKLTLPSLRNFVNDYNAAMNPNYMENSKKGMVQGRLLLFGGITNSPFVNNIENKSNPIFGGEIEVFEANNLPRHSLYLQLSHRLSSDDFQYSETQLGLGYRFRFINAKKVNIYANVTAATYNFTKQMRTVIIDDVATEREVKDNFFEVPFIFGIGADFKVSSNGFITVSYDELFALTIDNEGNFSTHITVGYKFNL